MNVIQQKHDYIVYHEISVNIIIEIMVQYLYALSTQQ